MTLHAAPRVETDGQRVNRRLAYYVTPPERYHRFPRWAGTYNCVGCGWGPMFCQSQEAAGLGSCCGDCTHG